jgi:hypothetical protein
MAHILRVVEFIFRVQTAVEWFEVETKSYGALNQHNTYSTHESPSPVQLVSSCPSFLFYTLFFTSNFISAFWIAGIGLALGI